MKLLNKTEVTFKGHIVHCHDIDGGDEFNVEVLINAKLPDDELPSACEEAARKNELCTLSGNTFEFEYLQGSGRTVMKRTERYEVSPIDPEAEGMLGQFQHG